MTVSPMLKQVPSELSPYGYPRHPGLATAVFYDPNLMQITQVTMAQNGAFMVLLQTYDAFPGSPESVTTLGEYSTEDEAVKVWEKSVATLQTQNLQQLMLGRVESVCPVARGYRYGDVMVESSTYDPYKQEVSLYVADAHTKGALVNDQMQGDTYLVEKMIEHLYAQFGCAPEISF